ncbi:hypothetical protein [Egicoccus sp. AB-alg2]|uniref:hypothetical protein n=1 Tax=Egicoccus sp. AB-alg2 TaxID=3242693 RepID=UPI00359ED65C
MATSVQRGVDARAFWWEVAEGIGTGGGRGAPVSRPFEALGACPDLGPLLRGRVLRAHAGQSEPCLVDGDDVLLRPELAREPALAALVVREALERSWLESSAGVTDGVCELAGRILAHAAAVVYTDLVRGHADAPLPATSAAARRSLHALADAVPGIGPDDARAVAADVLHALRDREDGASRIAGLDAATLDAAARRASDVLPVALPTAVLLGSGGDDRVVVDWTSVENRYGVSPLPRPEVVSFSSCTASSSSMAGFAAADARRRRLVARALCHGLETTLDREWTALRDALARTLAGRGRPRGTTVVPTPSGTDAETLALTVAASAGRATTTVLVAPLELGSGTELAATGRAFTDRTPQGGRLCTGKLLPGMPADVRSVAVEVRDEDGRLRDADAIEAEIATHLAAIVADGRQAVLHVVEGSKTGVRLPRPAALRSWEAAHGDRLDVVIDAAQLRVGAATVGTHLAAGRQVVVTGSKFLAGPPFSGALLIPPSLIDRVRARPWPEGVGVYLDRGAVPPALRALRRVASPAPNPGLLLRWSAALAQADVYLRLPVDLRRRVLAHLTDAACAALDRSPVAEPLDTPPAVAASVPSGAGAGAARPVPLEEAPSIFTFRVLADGEPLELTALRTVDRLLRTDLAAQAPPGVAAAARATLGRRFEFGQPVALGPRGHGGAALRLAIGAPTVCRVVRDRLRGPDLASRLRAEVADLRAGLDKLRLLLEHGVDQWTERR